MSRTAAGRGIPSEFDHGLSTRPVAYKPFPQAVPSLPVIDRAGTSPCTFSCPAGIKPHGYVSLIRKGEYEKAFDLVLDSTPLVGSLGRACYAQCEGECTRAGLEGPLPIRRLKRFAADTHYQRGDGASVSDGPAANGKQVAVIGSGPAGPDCRLEARAAGIPGQDLRGGGGTRRHAAAGHPDYRLPADVVERDIANVTALGVQIATDTRIEDLQSCGAQATTRS